MTRKKSTASQVAAAVTQSPARVAAAASLVVAAAAGLVLRSPERRKRLRIRSQSLVGSARRRSTAGVERLGDRLRKGKDWMESNRIPRTADRPLGDGVADKADGDSEAAAKTKAVAGTEADAMPGTGTKTGTKAAAPEGDTTSDGSGKTP